MVVEAEKSLPTRLGSALCPWPGLLQAKFKQVEVGCGDDTVPKPL